MKSQRTSLASQAVIVGGGLAGLTAAALLAKQGLKPVVLERSQQVGGRGASHEHHGFLLNQGAHALYKWGEAHRIFKRLGIRIKGNTPLPSVFLERQGSLHEISKLFRGKGLPVSLSWSDRWRLLRLFTYVLTRQHHDANAQTLEQWVERHLPQDAQALREIFFCFVRLTNYAWLPASQSAGAALRQMRLGLLGNVLYLDGGWRSIAEQLVEMIERHGGEVHTQAAVKQLHFKDGAVTGVSCGEGRFFSASNVILALPPKQAVSLLPEEVATELAPRIQGFVPVHAACLDVVLSSLPRSSPRSILGMDTPLYFAVHSDYADLRCGQSEPKGEVVQLVKYLPHNSQEDGRSHEDDLLALFSKAQPGWEDMCLYKRYLPKMVVSHAAVTPASLERGPIVLHEREGSKGVHLVGTWNAPHAMLLDGAVSSADFAVRSIAASISK